MSDDPKSALFWCPHDGCERHFTMQRGLTRHLRETHQQGPPDAERVDAVRPGDGTSAPSPMEHPAVVAIVALLPPLSDYDYELVDDVGSALHRALHAAYRSA